MNPEEPTLKLGLQVWWAFFWRSMLIIIPSTILVSIPIGIICAILRVGQETAGIFGGLFGLLIGLYITAYVVKRLMTKGFGQYRLVVVKK